jgi:hypothetical protein
MMEALGPGGRALATRNPRALALHHRGYAKGTTISPVYIAVTHMDYLGNRLAFSRWDGYPANPAIHVEDDKHDVREHQQGVFD